MQDMEQAIRERAYHLWMADGCQEGQAENHWLAAQREVLSESLGELGRIAAPVAKSKKTGGLRRKKHAA